MTMQRQITLGSLFDGIGAAPYAASFFGIKTLWASEILPSAISITRRHFPDMVHVGDITKLNGAHLPPVDVIFFGSPCQDLSTAAGGKRQGLSGARSGLFMEAIRIIREMREATNGKYPRFVCWENVPGAFSSGYPKGADFRAVLEAFAESEIPMPLSGKWANAGMVRGCKADIAWCVFDACRGFGLAQRRKRIFLVADFIGESSGEILFVPKSLFGHFAPGGFPGEGASSPAESCTHSTDMRAYGICSLASNSMKSSNPKSGIYEAEISRTLDTNACNPSCNQGGIAIAAFNGGASPMAGGTSYSETVSPTLKSSPSGLRTPCVCEMQIARTLTARGDSSPCSDRGCNIIAHPKITGTLCASAAGISPPGGKESEVNLTVAYCLQGSMIGRRNENGPAGSGVRENVSYTLNATDIPATFAVDCRSFKEAEDKCGTLLSKENGGYSLNFQNPVRQGYVVRRLTPTECERLMGLPDDWTKYGEDGKDISDSKRYSMLGNSIATPCAAYIMLGIKQHFNKSQKLL
jgi:DNA (cytosine-5)-methyltransferase 1